MNKKVLITNVKSRENVKKILNEIKPHKIVIISSRKIKFTDFDMEMENIRVKEDFETIIHEFNGILNPEDDFVIVIKPDKVGIYLLWLAQINLINPTYIMASGDIEQIPIAESSLLKGKESEILKLADCHGFIDPISINKEFGIKEEEAKKYLDSLSKKRILKFIETKEFKVGDEKKHPYYATGLLEKVKDLQDFYVLTSLGRIMLYVILTGQ
jgi:hypothetical protein